jgi:hypothetical protein
MLRVVKQMDDDMDEADGQKRSTLQCPGRLSIPRPRFLKQIPVLLASQFTTTVPDGHSPYHQDRIDTLEFFF